MLIKSFRYTLAITFIFALALSFERRAYAYVDPGSGLLVIQGIGTFLAGVSFYFRRTLKRLFSTKVSNPRQESTDRRERV